MSNLELLWNALNYIEEHLCDDVNTEQTAKACYCSKSTLEKLFRCVNLISIHDYITRRRMTRAAKRIAEDKEESILNIALVFGYSSHESFTRAFKSVWNCNPSEFRGAKYYELFPRYEVCLEEGSKTMQTKKKVDISQLYDLFVERKECYFICCDIKSMLPINEISIKAGDLAIIESMNRMNKAMGEEDVLFRIGGDEFCILTATTKEGVAEEIADKIRKQNGDSFVYEGKEIPLSLYVIVTKLNQAHIRYHELFAQLQSSLQDAKN